MPSFFFDVFNGNVLVRDEEGQTCASLAEAQIEAEEAARELAVITINRHAPIDDSEVRVRDGKERQVYAVRLRDILEVRSGQR